MTLYLVTGGAGFIGSHLATALVGRGDRVRVLDDLSSGSAANLAHLSPGEPGSGAQVELMRGSVSDPGAADAACQGVSAVFHHAAQVSVPQSVQDPVRSYEINVTGTLRMLEAARAAGVRNFVFAASSAAYGETEELPKVETMPPMPCSPYASGKLAGEHLLAAYGHVHGLATVSLRYFNIFGPRQADDSPYSGVIAIFAKALLEGRQATIFGDGEQTRDFTYVDNVVRANLAAIDRPLAPGTVVNVGTGESISIKALYAVMAELVGVEPCPNYSVARPGDVQHSVASLARARELLGYEPGTELKSGLATTVAWYRDRMTAARG